MRKEQEKVATTSENIENENLQKLRAVFPNFVKDGQIDFDALQAFLKKDGVLAGGEKYGLSWSGKSGAFAALRTPATGTLTPQKEESKDWDTTQNLFLEGDNLEVLKLLQKQYREEIKMIYIDPPYNTGKDFVYKDNFTQSVASYYEQTGQTQGGIKMTTNTETNGRYHSDWLTMMYPRLFLARNLLKEDGVIFISIDDNEVANLRLIMDEIFGEENFVTEFIWEKKKKPSFLDKNIGKLGEYILCYTKDEAKTFPFSVETTTEDKKYPINNAGNSLSTLIFPKDSIKFNLPDGIVKAQDMSEGNIKTKLLNDIEIKDGKNKTNVILEGEWRYSQEKLNEIINDNDEITISQIPFRPNHIKDGGNIKKMKNFLTLQHYQMETNEDSTKELVNIFGKDIFDNPKPVKLIKTFVRAVTYEDRAGIILDFFAGSGTTAHAVMDLNAEDNGNRKWICVQIPELTDEDSEAYKAGYKTIADISRERIRRAGKFLLENKADINNPRVAAFDHGFKSFKLSSSNYREWNTITDENDAAEILKQSKLFLEKPLVDGYKEVSVVYEILVKEGFSLNAKVEELKGKPHWWVVSDARRKIMISFDKKIDAKAGTTLGLSEEDAFVCFDSALDDTTKMNLGRGVNVKTI